MIDRARYAANSNSRAGMAARPARRMFGVM